MPHSHISFVAERPVANAVLMSAESLLGLGAPHSGRFWVPAIVIGVINSPIDYSCNILLRQECIKDSVN